MKHLLILHGFSVVSLNHDLFDAPLTACLCATPMAGIADRRDSCAPPRHLDLPHLRLLGPLVPQRGLQAPPLWASLVSASRCSMGSALFAILTPLPPPPPPPPPAQFPATPPATQPLDQLPAALPLGVPYQLCAHQLPVQPRRQPPPGSAAAPRARRPAPAHVAQQCAAPEWYQRLKQTEHPVHRRALKQQQPALCPQRR